MRHLPLLVLASLAIAPLAHGAARPVTPAYDGNCQGPLWSPDGASLAYEVNFHDKKRIELYVYEPGQGTPRRVEPIQRGSSAATAGFSTKADESVAHEPAWGPASLKRFVYSASTSSKDYELFLDGASAVIAGAPGADGGPTWSSDGKWIVFTSARTGQGDLYLLDVHSLDRPPEQLTFDDKSAELYATFSPDGKALAYVGHTDDGDNIYIMDSVTTRTAGRRFTDAPRTQTRPSWSPDGSAIAYYANTEDPERFDLYMAKLGGGAPQKLVEGVVMDTRGPSWTPDGKRLVFVLDDDSRYDPVYTVAARAGGDRKRVPTDTVGNTDLDVVRGTDGRTWLAVSAQGRTGDTTRDFKRIYVMSLD